MTVVLLQLPVPDHAGTDLPLAAACLENAWKRRVPAGTADAALDDRAGAAAGLSGAAGNIGGAAAGLPRAAALPEVTAGLPGTAGSLPGTAAEPCRFLHPPIDLINQGSDPAILDWLLASGADLVGFSLYLWNRERAEWLAARLRLARPELRLLAGGPEVTASRLPAAMAGDRGVGQSDAGGELPVFDWLVAGPGEDAFVALLAWLCGLPAARVPPLYRPRRAADSAGWPDPNGLHPWLDGSLDWPVRSAGSTPEGGGWPVHLETVRGCPNHCTYCHYGKQFRRLLFLPEPQIAAVIDQAARAGCRDLYLMDPSFSQRPGLDGFLPRLADWNRGRLAIHTELRLEDITPARAGLLAAAGVASVEAGLQSTNPQALAAVGRSWDRGRFEAGALALLAAGIRISTGIIIGLPHDGPDEIRATIDYVADLGLGEAAEAYPLALLPGTALRAEAGRLGLRFMDRPPYYILESPWLDQGELAACLEHAADAWGREGMAPIPPGVPGAFRADQAAQAVRLLAAGHTLPRTFSLRLSPACLCDRAGRRALAEAGRHWRHDSPHSECRLLIDLGGSGASADGTAPAWLPAALEELRAAFLVPGQLLERLRYYQNDPQGTWSSRLFVLAATPAQARAWLDSPDPGLAELVMDLAGSPCPDELLDWLLAQDWETLPFVCSAGAPGPGLARLFEGLENLIETVTSA